jgi:hypothetical protein
MVQERGSLAMIPVVIVEHPIKTRATDPEFRRPRSLGGNV